MEFHESLQRDLVKKQNLITKMKDELIVLRGPVSYDFIQFLGLKSLTYLNLELLGCKLP